MDLLKIQQSGYSNEDIKILGEIFLKNLDEYRNTLGHFDLKQISGLLHKLKGGLNLLMDDELVQHAKLIENKIKLETNNPETNKKIIEEINKLIAHSHLRLEELLYKI